MTDKRIIVSAVFYLIMAAFTYGNAVWWIDPIRNASGEQTRAPAFIMGAPLAAAVWPLYWSAKLQEPKP